MKRTLLASLLCFLAHSANAQSLPDRPMEYQGLEKMAISFTKETIYVNKTAKKTPNMNGAMSVDFYTVPQGQDLKYGTHLEVTTFLSDCSRGTSTGYLTFTSTSGAVTHQKVESDLKQLSNTDLSKMAGYSVAAMLTCSIITSQANQH